MVITAQFEFSNEAFSLYIGLYHLEEGDYLFNLFSSSARNKECKMRWLIAIQNTNMQE